MKTPMNWLMGQILPMRESAGRANDFRDGTGS